MNPANGGHLYCVHQNVLAVEITTNSPSMDIADELKVFFLSESQQMLLYTHLPSYAIDTARVVLSANFVTHYEGTYNILLLSSNIHCYQHNLHFFFVFREFLTFISVIWYSYAHFYNGSHMYIVHFTSSDAW